MQGEEQQPGSKSGACEVNLGLELDETPEPPTDHGTSENDPDPKWEAVSRKASGARSNRRVSWKDEQMKSETGGWKRFVGVFLALVAAMCSSLILVLIKLTPHMHPITQTIWRQGVATLIGILGALGINSLKGRGLVKKDHDAVFNGIIELDADVKIHWRSLVNILLAGVLLVVAMLAHVTALEYLTIGDATVTTYLSLVFYMPLARLLLHENCRLTPALMAALIIVGAFVIARPPHLTSATALDTQLAIGLVLKLLDGFGTALFMVTSGKFQQHHFLAVFILTSLTGFCIALPIAFVLDLFVWPDGPRDVTLLILLGILSATSHNMLILALKFDSASTVALVRCSDILFALVWQRLIFHVVPDEWSIIGIVLVSTGVLVTSVSKMVGDLPTGSETKKRLRFLLK